MTTATLTNHLVMPGARLLVRKAGVSASAKWGILLLLCAAACTGISLMAGFTTGFSLMTAIAFMAAILGLYRPGLGLIGISMLCTMDTLDRALLFTGGLFPWNTLNYWLLAVMFLSITFLMKLSDLQSRLLELGVIILLFGLLFTPVMPDGIETTLNVVTFFGILYYFFRNARDDSAWFWQAVVSGVVGAGLACAFFLEMARLPPINANAWAYFPLTAMFAICLGFRCAPHRGKGQLVLGLLALVNLVWIFLSGSRGTLIVGLVCMVYIIFSTRSKAQQIGYLALGALIAVFVTLNFAELNQTSMHRINKLLDPEQSMTGRTSGRSDLAYGGLLIFLDHPFGVGTGGFSVAWAKMGFRQSLSGYGYGASREAHAGWIKVLAENGFLGFIVLGSFAISFAVMGWRKRRAGLFSVGLFVTSVLLVAWVSTEFASKGIWFLTAGATVILNMRGTAGLPPVPARSVTPPGTPPVSPPRVPEERR
jgi:O-antigen ligase